MDIIRNGLIENKTVVALGNFDGLHSAHTAIINNACTYAKEKGLTSCVLLFNDHTANVINGPGTKLLTTDREKLEILEGMGVDSVYICDFDEEFMRLSAEEFSEFLKTKLNCSAVCIGYDYRFGHKAEGDAALLSKLGKEIGIDVIITDEIKYMGSTVKSTKIRDFIAKGKMESARAMLGRDYFLIGPVEKGLQNGRKLGAPTANIGYGKDKLIPKTGVYAGYTTVAGVRYKSVINVGNNPTFGADKVTVESHLLGFSGEIYGQTVKVEFISRIRGEQKFDGIDQLKAQIEKDIETAKKYMED